MYLCDELLQNLGIRRLRVAEIHELVEQLINYDEIISNRFLFQLFEVLGKNLDEQYRKVSFDCTMCC